jgi:O-antigen ligase
MKRYDNQKLLNLLTPKGNDGRPDLALTEIKMFTENPVLGVGAGLGAIKRKLEFKTQGCSHNEFTRMMAEQGFLGIISILLLIIIPIQIYFGNKNNVYFFSFYAFWFLTINHSAMRIAAPSFMYALTLLHINSRKKSQSVQEGYN